MLTTVEVVLVVIAVVFLAIAYIEDAAFRRRSRHAEYLRKLSRRLERSAW